MCDFFCDMSSFSQTRRAKKDKNWYCAVDILTAAPSLFFDCCFPLFPSFCLGRGERDLVLEERSSDPSVLFLFLSPLLSCLLRGDDSDRVSGELCHAQKQLLHFIFSFLFA